MHATLQTIIEKATNLPIAEVEINTRPPLEYQNTNLYDVWTKEQHLIAKEWTNPRDMSDSPHREFSALQLLQQVDIAPQPIFYDPSLAPIVVYEFMDGLMWDRQKPSAHQLKQLAELWLRVHAVSVGDSILANHHEVFSVALQINRYVRQFRRYMDWAEQCFPVGLAVAPHLEALIAQVSEATAKLDELSPLLCFGRADPRFANVIQRPDGRVGLIDWEDSGLRDPAHDAADLLIHPNNEDLLTLNEWQAFLGPYLAERERFDPMTNERMHLYMAIFPVFWLSALLEIAVKRAEVGTLDEWLVNGMEPNQRMRRYLARALAWPDEDFADELEKLGEMSFFER